MPSEPAMLGDGELTAQGLACSHSECFCTDVAPEFGYLGVVAPVVPGDGRRDGAAAVVDQYTGLTHARDPDARDGDPLWQPLDRLSEGVNCTVAQLIRVNLGAARVPMPDCGAPAAGERLSGVVIDDGLT